MALATDIELSAEQNALEVGVGIKMGKIDLKVCPHPSAYKYTGKYTVLYEHGEKPAVLKITRSPRTESVTYSVIDLSGYCVYKGNKLPPVCSIHKGIAYKLNRFIGKVLFKISEVEMACWAKSVSKEMILDARRHARNMIAK